jgi:hypothetical protein
MIVQLAMQFGLQILLPGFLLYELARSRHRSRREWLVEVGTVGLTLLFAFLVARWDWFSYYLRLLLPLLCVVAGYLAYRRIGLEPLEPPEKMRTHYLTRGVVIVVLLWLNVNALRGYFYPGEAVELAYPLQGSVYYVGGGGSSRWINNHHAFPPQDYALDILRLNGLGNRALGLWPEELSRYAIYGDTIYSPCSGEVVRVVDGRPDQVPPSRDSDRFAGNHVVLACQGVEVVLAHLMEESILVEEGSRVNEGEALGRVGNSGHTTQPHLHIHAERGGAPDQILNGAGVPITFRGRFLERNSLFTGR